MKKRKITIGIDEAGRGPLAGPVVAAAVASFNDYELRRKLGIKDSKQLSFQRRKEIYNSLEKNENIEWGIGRVGEKLIDKINILEATKLAMKRAVLNLQKRNSFKVKMILLDGNFKINMDYPQRSYVKGDERIFLISLASIIAKVKRDRMMENYHKRFPDYGFNKNMGYPTKDHKRRIKKNGSCRIHRRSFKLRLTKID